MQRVADALGASDAGKKAVAALRRRLQGAVDACRGRRRWRIACIQPGPKYGDATSFYAAGGWLPELLRLISGTDALQAGRPAVVAAPIVLEALHAAQPDAVIVAAPGITLERVKLSAETLVAALQQKCGTASSASGRLALAMDGMLGPWRPGPRLVDCLEALCEALHSESQQFGHEGRLWAVLGLPMPAACSFNTGCTSLQAAARA